MNILTGFVSSPLNRSPSANRHSPGSTDSVNSSQHDAYIFKLPSEIIHHILSYLEAQHLVSFRRACKAFCSHADEDRLWIELIKPNVPSFDRPAAPGSAPSWRHLFLSHHPYWFIPRQKIWFSDDRYNGKLILAKFDPRRGTVDGYRIAAERPEAVAQLWSYKPSVVIHQIDPSVYLSTDNPVLSLTPDFQTYNVPAGVASSQSPRLPSVFSTSSSRTNWTPNSELCMRVGRPEQKINAALLLTKNLPHETASSPHVAVWPPRTIPDMPRVRSSSSSGSSDKFTSPGHKPQKLDDVSQTTFRLRMWSQFTQGMLNLGVRISEEISTWSTLDPALYTPTKEKPYQGIFIGDYAGHGCEFLLVLQTDAPPPRRRLLYDQDDEADAEEGDERARARSTRPSNYIRAVLAALRDEDMPDLGDGEDEHNSEMTKDENTATSNAQNVTPNVPDEGGFIHKGSLQAIKLTGDVNIPRGEHTFFADDIGPAGTIRIAHEAPFTGARVVRSKGHVAARGFRDDEFIPSQLFLVNQDTLAQYWLPFAHISYYKRIDIDELLRDAGQPRRSSG